MGGVQLVWYCAKVVVTPTYLTKIEPLKIAAAVKVGITARF